MRATGDRSMRRIRLDDRTRKPAWTLVALLLLLVLLPPGGGADAGSATLVYTPSTSDAQAIFLRLRVNPETACWSVFWNVTMDYDEPVPWIFSRSSGFDSYEVAGQEVPVSAAGRNLYRTWTTAPEWQPQEGDGHLMLNASAGGTTVFAAYQQTGYDGRSGSKFVSLGPGVFCNDEVFHGLTPWFSYVGTPHVRNARVTLQFYETYDPATKTGTHGAARGWITFAADSNRTFLRQLKDFDGPASYNGDPLGLGQGPNAAGVLLQESVHVDRGLAGGILDIHTNSLALSALSYVGPGGVAGAQTQTVPLLPAQMLSMFEGPAGDWTFHANLYATPQAYSTLYLWGADIETR